MNNRNVHNILSTGLTCIVIGVCLAFVVHIFKADVDPRRVHLDLVKVECVGESSTSPLRLIQLPDGRRLWWRPDCIPGDKFSIPRKELRLNGVDFEGDLITHDLTLYTNFE